MKGKFFYKIDYNTDNGKKQHRNSKVGKNYHNLESSGPKAGKTLYFWACIPHFGTDTVEKQGSGCIICAEKAILKDVAGQKKHSGGNKIMTRNSKNEYSKNEYSKNGYEKSEYSKNQKNSRDCNHVKDREMSSYGQQNREQDEKDEYEKY